MVWNAGVAYAFHRGGLWLASIDGTENDSAVTKLEPFMSRPIGTVAAHGFAIADHEAWNFILKRLLRQSLALQILRKSEATKGLVADRYRLIDTGGGPAVRNGDVSLYPAVDFDRFYRTKDERIVVSCSLAFAGVTDQGLIVKRDRALGSLFQSAYRLSPDGCWSRLERAMRNILPLDLHLSSETIRISSFGLPLGA